MPAQRLHQRIERCRVQRSALVVCKRSGEESHAGLFPKSMAQRHPRLCDRIPSSRDERAGIFAAVESRITPSPQPRTMLDTVREQLSSILGPAVTEWLSLVFWKGIAPIFAQPTLHLLFIASTLAVIAVYFFAVVKRAEPGQSFWRYAFPKAVFAHPSAIADYKFYVANQFVLTYLRLGQFVVGLVSLLYIAQGVTALLATVLGERVAVDAPPWWIAAIFTLVFTIAYDFGRFLSHFVQHRSEILWEFHKVHHSAEVLTPMSSFRAHPVDQAIEFLFRSLTTAPIIGVFGYFYPSGIEALTILNYSAITFLFYLTSHLRHSHVPLGFGAASNFFVSPVMHQLHHSAAREHFDKNFGFIFSAWDRLFGTLYVPRADEKWLLGLPADAGRYDSVWRLFAQPFVGIYRLLVDPKQRASIG
jgi:sterol desaturase/sphingolipid hydroxylase (fatty acid hydroxylase superfamily)